MRLYIRVLALACVFVAASLGYGQSISGFTTVTIDPTTLMVTATCETDLDGYSEGVYNPSVTCVLTDGAGNTLASGTYLDTEDESYAQVTLEFQGIAGTTYIATGHHYAWMAIQLYDPDEDPPNTNLYRWDEYNFSDYAETAPPNPYPYYD